MKRIIDEWTIFMIRLLAMNMYKNGHTLTYLSLRAVSSLSSIYRSYSIALLAYANRDYSRFVPYFLISSRFVPSYFVPSRFVPSHFVPWEWGWGCRWQWAWWWGCGWGFCKGFFKVLDGEGVGVGGVRGEGVRVRVWVPGCFFTQVINRK